jgi:hypothetical protein
MTGSSSLERIVSGGQTGVDRGALDAAIEHGLPHGGWCPKGRRAEDGVIPARYELRQGASADYSKRTLQNVLDSDGTLILNRGPLTGGTALTASLAESNRKPILIVALDRHQDAARVVAWIVKHHIRTLNVAGPRESGSPGISEAARLFLLDVLGSASP